MVEKKLGFSHLRDSGLNLNPQQDGLRISVPIPKVSISVAIITQRTCILSILMGYQYPLNFMLWKEVLWIAPFWCLSRSGSGSYPKFYTRCRYTRCFFCHISASVHSFIFLFSVVGVTIFIILFSLLTFSEKSSMIYIWFKPDPGKIMPIWQDPDMQHCWNMQLWPTDPSADPDPALFISGFKDTNKKYFFKYFLKLHTFTSGFQDKKVLKKSQNSRNLKFFLLFFAWRWKGLDRDLDPY